MKELNICCYRFWWTSPYAYVLDGVTQPALAFEAASTYRFDVSDASNAGHVIFLQGTGQSGTPPAGLDLTAVGTPGQQGAYVDVIVESGYSLTGASYNCVITLVVKWVATLLLPQELLGYLVVVL